MHRREMFWDFNSLKLPSMGFLVIQTWNWPDFNLESGYYFIKNLTDFRKTVETGVDPRLSLFMLP